MPADLRRKEQKLHRLQLLDPLHLIHWLYPLQAQPRRPWAPQVFPRHLRPQTAG